MSAEPGRIILGMSGGVDSTVAAFLLKEAGYDVTGVMLLTAGVDSKAMEKTRDSAGKAGIGLVIEDVASEFEEKVVKPFIKAYEDGFTPNPCVMCNPAFKFRVLCEIAEKRDIRQVATGHFARLASRSGKKCVAKGASPQNDQSYFLYRLSEDIRERLAFPLGDLCKDEVRLKAETLGLGFSHVRSSQEVCFMRGHLRDWLEERSPGLLRPGPAYDISTGNLVGRHKGAASLTIGQRRGHGVAIGERAYIAEIDFSRNTVYMGGRKDCTVGRIYASLASYQAVTEEDLAGGGMLLDIRTRSSMEPVKARVSSFGGLLEAVPEKPIWAAAKGQSLVCYDGDAIACGGIIVKEERI